MSGEGSTLSPEARDIILEEEALLRRVLASLEEAQRAAAARAPGRGELRSVGELRALRDEAAAAANADLPALLSEMSVRQRLIARQAGGPLPDPRSPYLAHLRMGTDGGSKDYLLGHASFVDTAAGVRVVDWRLAPVAQLFYRYREGDAFEESLPGGRELEGVVEARRVLVIAQGRLTQVVSDRFVLTRREDGGWEGHDREALSLQAGGAGTAARPGSLGVGAGRTGRAQPADVTALLDAEQYAAVCSPARQPLLVLGSAGSGKTTVALHRLARLFARQPQRYPLSRMRVVVPEEALARLSARLLEPLGVGATQVRTLDAWARGLARAVFRERLPGLCLEPPALVSSLKRHPALYGALRERLATLRPASATLKRLRRRLAELFTDRDFLGGVVAAAGGDLPSGVVEETVRHTMLQLAEPVDKQLESVVVSRMKEAVDGRGLAEDTPDELAGTVDVEDLPILLFLRAWRAGIAAQPIAHLVLDEAEDFSLFELFVLGRALGETRSVTLAGDEAQQTSSSFAGWKASLEALDVGEAAVCRLAISYRCPRPVVELARSILGNLAPEAGARAAREGAPVGCFHFPKEAQAHLFLAGAVRDLVEREPQASVAVIAGDAAAAQRFHPLVADVPAARLVLRGDFSFEPGLDVTFVENTKGLEFDYVILPDASAATYPATDEARRRLHVAVTRAAHQLWVVSTGAPSPLLASLASKEPERDSALRY